MQETIVDLLYKYPLDLVNNKTCISKYLMRFTQKSIKKHSVIQFSWGEINSVNFIFERLTILIYFFNFQNKFTNLRERILLFKLILTTCKIRNCTRLFEIQLDFIYKYLSLCSKQNSLGYLFVYILTDLLIETYVCECVHR